MDNVLAGTLFSFTDGVLMPGYCPASLRRLLLVKNLPLQAERHSGEPQKLFAFRPECCSDSQRNGVRLQTGIAFTFDRIPYAKSTSAILL
jgi:hypothetical protein